MEKIFKLETLKMPTLSSLTDSSSLNSSVIAAANDSVKKKERISHCINVTDAVCSSQVQNLSDYSKILENVTEVLFQLCNDPDSDIRLVATDCLHRIVRTVKDQFQHRFQMEIYKEIKKNQNPKSLKIALNLFAFMSPLIRPQKCRVFMLSLLPCFAQISKRTEEVLYENLAPAFCEIFKNLGPFVNDNEVKILCKDFMGNLESSSAIIRRSSASILVYICQYSRKPHVFLPKLLFQVTDLLVPKLMEKSVSIIIGALLCIRIRLFSNKKNFYVEYCYNMLCIEVTNRQCIQPIFEQLRQNFEKKSPDQDNVVKNLIQVYEMCMILCNHDDHNVITTSLDTLKQLLTSPVEQVVQLLTSPLGIQNSLHAEKWDLKAESGLLSSSMCSLEFSDTTNLLEGDSDVPNFRSLISSTASEVKEDFDMDMSFSSSRRNSDVFPLEAIRENEYGSSMEVLQQSDDEQVEKSSYSLALENFPEIHIGSLYESNIPLYYCARFLAYNFLLSGQAGHERPDTEVRTSVKVLATNCLINLISIRPEIFCLVIAADENENETKPQVQQTIQDITLYLKHTDPLLRGSIYILIGNLIKAILQAGFGSSESIPIQVDDVIPFLNEGLRDSSSIGVKTVVVPLRALEFNLTLSNDVCGYKRWNEITRMELECAIEGISTCLIPVLRTKSGLSSVSDMLQALLITANNSYWLVKVDLVELLASIEWDYVADKVRKEKEVMNLLLDLLSDEDVRVRSATINALINFTSFHSPSDVKTTILCDQSVINQVSSCSKSEVKTSSHRVESVLMEMFKRIGVHEEKYAIAGFYAALDSLSENFPPRKHIVWRCAQSPDICSLFSISMDLLRSNAIVYDVSIHQSILSLTCNLFIGFISNVDVESVSSSEGNLFCHPDSKLSDHGVMLLHHCLAVMKLYQSLIEHTSFSQSSSRKVSASPPVISPVIRSSKVLLAGDSSEPEKKRTSILSTSTTCPLHFKKIAAALGQNWKIYKSNLDPAVTTKFTSLLITSLNVLGQLFEYIRSDFVGLASFFDDVLYVTSSLFHLCPIPTLRCIQKMLSCLFAPFKSEHVSHNTSQSVTSRYENIKDPFEKFVVFADVYHNSLLMSRKSTVAKTPSEKSALSNYIRQFEPIVVTALRMYTTSSDVAIQAEVLRLLCQLIKGHVNYGLVDKSQVFLGFVIKQIGFLEEGHIRNDGEMVEEMFNFLTLLSHEQNHSNRFIDIPKILRLCDGLVASGQNPVMYCLPALKGVVHDLFIKINQSTSTNIEKKELETQREVLFQMLMKLSTVPQALPVLWVVIEGRRGVNELKWHEDSATVTSYLLPLIENGELLITNKQHFCGLMAILFSVSLTSLPPVDNIVATMQEAIKLSKHTKPVDFLQWQLLVTSHFLIMVKLVNSQEGSTCENECTASFILEMVNTYVQKLLSIVSSPVVENNRQFVMSMLIVFLQSFTTFIRKDKCPNVLIDLRSEDNVKEWITMVENLLKLNVLHPAIRNNAVELLATLLYPHVVVWLVLTQSAAESEKYFVPQIVLRLMKELNGADVPALEEWITTSHTHTVVVNIDNPVVYTFVSRLSKFRIQTILEEMGSILDSGEIELLLGKNILKFLERVYQNFLLETGILSIKMFQRTQESFVLFEVTQFASFVFSLWKSENVEELSPTDKDVLTEFLKNKQVRNRYPRLVKLIENLDVIENLVESEDNDKRVSPIPLWCSGEINQVEGNALAELLSNLDYSELVGIFNLPTFNLSLLRHCFFKLQKILTKDLVSAEDVSDLFSAEKRCCLKEKLPLGVVTFEFMENKLQEWTNSIDERILHSWKDDECDKIIEEISFADHLVDIWGALESLLQLKGAVGLVTESCTHNVIPTKVFAFSFQYMRVKSERMRTTPVENLHKFLSFAAAVVLDPTFTKSVSGRVDLSNVFTYVKCLGAVLRHIVRTYNLNFTFDNSTSETSEMNTDCARILAEFNYMSHFIHEVAARRLPLDPLLYKSLKNVVSGLGKCDTINVWILISHLGWKPTSLLPNQIFPVIEQIPLEIIQNEKDLLLQYIFKLNLFGVASKIQFEENWMIFLSVINSYGDENSQMQIVCTGLRALSMMLEKTVKFVYISIHPKSLEGLANIDLSLEEIEPSLCKNYQLPLLLADVKKTTTNLYGVDANSCIRFLIDLFSQWLQNPQGKMPLLLLSEVVQSIVRMAEYFEDTSQYNWMLDTLMEIFKSFEKEDDILWPHLIYGIMYAAAKVPLETDAINNVVQILDGALTSSSVNVSSAAVDGSLIFLQHHPDSFPVLNVVTPYVLRNTHLSETINDSENHSCATWTLLLFTWIHGPSDNIGGASFEQETLSNILTVLSPLNKVNISVRLLVLKALQKKIQMKTLAPDAKRKISKATLDTLKTNNIVIFFEAVKLFVTIFYTDFENFCQATEPEPETIMQMVERTEVLFSYIRLKNSAKSFSLIISKVIPHIMMDFLPPSEILNRVISEFLSPQQNYPELLAPTMAKLFEKARRKPKEGALVREWIVSSVQNFISNPDVSRIMWSLTLFFIGVSTTQKVIHLLAFAELRRGSLLSEDLLIHATLDFYSSLNQEQKDDFVRVLTKGPFQPEDKNPYKFLLDVIHQTESSPVQNE